MCDVGYLRANFSLPIGLSVLKLGPMYATDRQTDVRQKHRLIPPPYGAEARLTSFRWVLQMKNTCHP